VEKAFKVAYLVPIHWPAKGYIDLFSSALIEDLCDLGFSTTQSICGPRRQVILPLTPCVLKKQSRLDLTPQPQCGNSNTEVQAPLEAAPFHLPSVLSAPLHSHHHHFHTSLVIPSMPMS
jgi:hypothetical protein